MNTKQPVADDLKMSVAHLLVIGLKVQVADCCL